MQYLSYTIGIVLLVFALIQLVYRNKIALNCRISLSYALSGSILMYVWASRIGLVSILYPLYGMVVVQAFLFAPSLYSMFCHITGLVPSKPSLHLYRYIPAAVSFIYILGNNIANSPVIRSGVVPRDPGIYPTFFAAHLLNILADLYILLFLVRMLRSGAVLLRSENKKGMKELHHLFRFIRVFTVTVVLMIGAGVVRQDALIDGTRVVSALIFVVFMFYSFRNPEFIQVVIRNATMIRYRNSRLKGMDTTALLARLEYLMVTEKVFTDAELSLYDLSSRLLVTPHQLSEIVNERLGVNFCTFLNRYRIREAERLLLGNRGLSVLAVAFEVGFNSKACFNDHFRRQTGLTPSGYRAKHSAVP